LDRSALDWPAGVTVYNPEKCYNGFTLVSDGVWWELIDMKGRIVNRWYGDPELKLGTQIFERFANGNYVSNCFHVTEQDWDGNVLWSLPFEREGRPSSSKYHHDIQRLSNGNYIVMVREYVDDLKISKVRLQDDHLMEVTPEKRIVWEWWGHEHFDEFEFTDEAKKIIHETGGGEVGAHPPPREEWFLGDWLHNNTISVLPKNPLYQDGDSRFKPGNLLLCSRNTNTVFIIDKSGSIVWKWGSLPKMRGFWILGVGDTRNCLVGPHDPNMLDNGNILIYDNGGSGGYPPVVRFFTRLVEINPASGEIVWEYVYTPSPRRFLSITTGGLQRLPNGNTLSLDSNQGRIFEVTPQGEIVWEYVKSRGGSYRTQRISYEDCLKADPYYMETDGHLGVKPAETKIPEGMGLPVRGGPDYCPRFYNQDQ